MVFRQWIGDSVELETGVGWVVGESAQSRLGMLIDGANGSHQTGIQKGFHAGAKLRHRLLCGTRDFSFHGLMVHLASDAIFRFERSKFGTDTFGRFGDDKLILTFETPLELLERAVGRLLNQGTRFAAACIEVKSEFTCHVLSLP